MPLALSPPSPLVRGPLVRGPLVRLLFIVQLISMGAMEMSGPFWPLHLKSLSPSTWAFGIASVGVYIAPMLGIALTSALWGRIGDRTGHKLMMVRALLGLALTQLALAYALDVWLILALRFLQGACAGYIAPAQAYGVSIEAPERRARLFALLQISTNVGSLLGALVGGVILDFASFFWINFSAALICGVCALAVVVLVPKVPPQPAPPRATAREGRAWHRSPLLGLLAVMGLLLVVRLMPQMPFSLYVSSLFGVKNWVVGLCYGLLALGFIVSATAWARFFEPLSATQTLLRIKGVVLACALVTGLAALTRSAPVFIGLYFVWGVLLGATTPVLMALISREASRRQQGFILGLAQSTAQLSSIAGIALGGWLSQSLGLESLYICVALAYMAALMPLALVRRSRSASSLTSEDNSPMLDEKPVLHGR